MESELEANAVLTASLLSHPPADEPTVDVSDLPGGVRDAWAVISDASVKETDDNVAATAAPSLTISNNILNAAKRDSELPMGQGQLGKVIHTTSLSGCLQREASLAQKIRDDREKEGPTLKRALAAAKSVPNYENIWMKVFDERMRQIQTYHARHQYREEQVTNKRQKKGNPATDGYDLASAVAETIAPLQQGALFNEEEVMGKYLDFHPLFDSNMTLLKKLVRIDDGDSFTLSDFLALLSKGSLAETIAEEGKLKERKHYVRFLVALQNYLEGFIKRTSPLLNRNEQIIKPALDDFVKEWSKTGGVEGWEAKPAEAALATLAVDGADNSSADEQPKGIDLSPFASAGDLEKAFDGDQLKAELARLGLKCGGTVSDRAKRLFMTKDTPLDKLPKKLFAKKNSTDGLTGGSSSVSAKSESRVDIAKREAIITALLHHLRPTLEATSRRLDRRQAQTLNEREQELEEELHGSAVEEGKKTKEGEDSDEEEDDEDTPIYNPKGVPLGWDGKPIPYWLFKLHGLNHFYSCEICGNESYRGRRNFELHFTEAKHSYGMKCLGIPNTVCWLRIVNICLHSIVYLLFNASAFLFPLHSNYRNIFTA